MFLELPSTSECLVKMTCSMRGAVLLISNCEFSGYLPLIMYLGERISNAEAHGLPLDGQRLTFYRVHLQ